jgi:hypothetical protein
VENTNEIINELHSEAARLLKLKSSKEFIVSSLMAKGIDQHYAEMIVENVKSDKSDRKEFYRHLFGGSFVLFAGIILTFGTYSLVLTCVSHSNFDFKDFAYTLRGAETSEPGAGKIDLFSPRFVHFRVNS